MLTQLEIPQAAVCPPVLPRAVKTRLLPLAELTGCLGKLPECLGKLTGRLVETTVRVMDSETSSMREGPFVLALLFLIALAWFGA